MSDVLNNHRAVQLHMYNPVRHSIKGVLAEASTLHVYFVHFGGTFEVKYN